MGIVTLHLFVEPGDEYVGDCTLPVGILASKLAPMVA
nr:MAG TPA: Porphobilinogen deaminase, C-terminal domain [Caudoviricetes sp.]